MLSRRRWLRHVVLEKGICHDARHIVVVVKTVGHLFKEAVEGFDLEFVEGGAHIVAQLVHLVVVVGEGGEAFEEQQTFCLDGLKHTL